MKNKALVVLLMILAVTLISANGMPQGSRMERSFTISWNPARPAEPGAGSGMTVLSFDGSALRPESGLLPVFVQAFPYDPARQSVDKVTVTNPVFVPCPAQETAQVRGLEKISPEIVVNQETSVTRKVSSLAVSLVPLRRDSATGTVERLVSFTLVVEMKPEPAVTPSRSVTAYAGHSVLATGNWYKIAVGLGGLYRITYDDLKSAGVDVANIDPRNIRIYGNGGGMLPEANAAPRTDDLMENAIYVSGESDGHFDQGDYILFYGESPDQWVYNNVEKLFHHRKNIYSDRTYYFLTADLGPGKRISDEASTTRAATCQATRFEDYAFYEKDDKNLIGSGRQWWDGQLFDVTTDRSYSFSFPDIDGTRPVTILTDVAAKCTETGTSFVVSAQGTALKVIYLSAVSGSFENSYADEKSASATFLTSDPAVTVGLRYNKGSASAVGYLNYIEMNATRMLTMSGSQMSFRSASCSGVGSVTDFTLNGNGQSLQIWDVTNGGNVKRLAATQSGANYTFRVETDTLREFIAFDGTTFRAPEFVGKVENQDLHSTPSTDYVIVCHPSFLDQAERLAEFHRTHSGLSVFITTPQKIYNEFSSGAQDITAIRDFMRMLYNRAEPGSEPKYLLLFGDASYDYKDRIANNSNFVPAYEAAESLSPTDSYVTDDYFVLLDTDEGQSAYGTMDAGVGRFPVSSEEQAREAVDKVIHYCSGTDPVKNDWRNVITFVADDQNEGGNMFVQDSESFAATIESKFKDYNVDKIYSDSYQMVSTPGGGRYPDVNAAINKRVEKGTLIMNYVGHGGEVGWAHERILEVPDIKGWQNIDNMPVFVTATCEFSRFDDPERTSAGEWVFLNGNGGGIALFTTTRLTYAGTNKTLLVNLYNYVFDRSTGDYLKLGDLLIKAKTFAGSSGVSANVHAFVLLGDPAMKMAYPDLNVVTTSINSVAPSSVPDTLRALEQVTITGEVRDHSGDLASDFSGTVFPTVFDKASEVWTLANQKEGDPVQFFLRKNPVYKGKVNVVNGKFSFSFIVPKDIALNFGNGKISYYAKSQETDANGYDSDILVGGYNTQAGQDIEGPEVALFMNDHHFVSGGITDPNPVLLADVSDSSGVNTVGNGIGHDITAILDGKTTEPVILNDYYVSDLDTYKSGEISYPLSGLADGPHNIRVKVWDVYNNSTDASIDFIVVSSAEFGLKHLYNYPNPMKDQTTFAWETNVANDPVEIEIRIYTINGSLIKTIRQNMEETGFRNVSILWDGTQDDGRKIGTGLYVYRMQMTLPNGAAKGLTSKLVVIR